MSTRHHFADIFIVRRKGPDGRKGSTMNSTASVPPGEGWAPSGCTLPMTHHVMKTSNHTIPDRSLSGSTRTAPSAVQQDEGVKHVIGASSKIRGRDNITVDTWNTMTLNAAEKLLKLTHEMDRYRWNILEIYEMKWKNSVKTAPGQGPKVSFSGKEDKHEHGLDFLFSRTS